MRKTLLALIAALTGMGAVAVTGGGPAAAVGTHFCSDGKTDETTGPPSDWYDEPRVFVEGQGWWQSDNPDLDAGHIHVGACIPLGQPMAGSWPLKIRLIMHDNPSSFDELVVFTRHVDDSTRNQIAIVPDSGLYADTALQSPLRFDQTGPADGNTKVRWTQVTVSADDFAFAGRQMIRLRAFTDHPTVTSTGDPKTERFTGILGFPVDIVPGPTQTVSDYTRDNVLRGKGAYTRQAEDGLSYCESSIDPASVPLGTITGGATVDVALIDHKTGPTGANRDNLVSTHSVTVDRNAHGGVDGIDLLPTGTGVGPLPSSTPQPNDSLVYDFEPVTIGADLLDGWHPLADGWHTLSLKTDCVDTKLGTDGAASQSGLLNVRFRTDRFIDQIMGTGSGPTGPTSWQVFDLDGLTVGESTTVQLHWDDPDANLNLFVRRPGGSTPHVWANGGDRPEEVTFTPDEAGTWTVAVKVKTSPNGPVDFMISTSGS